MKVFCFILLFFITSSFASTMLSVGTYVPGAFTAQEDWDGGKQMFEINPMVTIGTQFQAFGDQFFTPEIGYAHHRNAYDGVERSTIMLLYNMTYRLTGTLLFRYGLGTFWERYSGDGGTVVLNNGNSTQAFYRPDGTTTSYHTDLMIGAEQFISPRKSIRFDLLFTGWADAAIDNKNYILTLNLYDVL